MILNQRWVFSVLYTSLMLTIAKNIGRLIFVFLKKKKCMSIQFGLTIHNYTTN